MNEYVHLHNHSEYSTLDGLSKIDDMVSRAKALGQKAIAVTDHGSLSGAYQLHRSATQQEITPIIGCETYVAPESRFHKKSVMWGTEEQRRQDVSRRGSYTHLTLLATNDIGVRNLYGLYRESFSGFYNKPRIDFELLSEHSEGLVCLTGCASGAVATRLRLGQVDEAKRTAALLASIFPGRLFVEVMSHGISWEEELNKQLVEEIGHSLNLPLVLTQDSHYVNPGDAEVQDALICVGTYAQLKDENRMKFDGGGYYLKSAAEMATLGFPDEAMRNTLVIAEMVEPYTIFDHKLRMPKYRGTDTLTERCFNSVRIQSAPDDTYRDRLNYELGVITKMGFADYFLVLATVLEKARERGIRIGPGRGSAGGSLAAYALGITDLDPLAHGLLFERFLNPERVSLPDVDLDVNDHRRQELLEIIREEYGHENVTQLGTFAKIGAKRALEDASRVLGEGYKPGRELAKLLPRPVFGKQPLLSDGTDLPNNPIVSLAKGLEGTVRSEGVHAGGVIISPQPLSEIIPVRVHDRTTGATASGFDMHEVEALGLVKYDILGLTTLGVIDECLRMLGDVPGRLTTSLELPITPEKCDDAKTYALLRSGHTLGVFQLDSVGMQRLLRDIKPVRFDHISAVLALYRPGPMGADAHRDYAKRASSGSEWNQSWAIHPEFQETLRPVLQDTYGIIVYQEQLMKVVQVAAGFNLAQADILRKACGKKDARLMAEQQASFVVGTTQNGYSRPAIDKLWEVIVPFADYSFNKSHTAGYGLIAYWSAFLKANYPAEWMVALLTSVADTPDKLQEYVDETQRIGLSFKTPDINLSGASFSPDGDGIRYGLCAIRGVAEAAYAAVESKRPYSSIDDFFKRAPKKALNSGVLGALIRSGAFDSLTPAREDLFDQREMLVEDGLEWRKNDAAGDNGFFTHTISPQLKTPRDLSLREKWEKELLGVKLSAQHLSIRLTERWTEEGTLEYIKMLLDSNPGKDHFTVVVGGGTIDAGNASYPRIKRQLALVEGVTVDEDTVT